MPSRYDLAVDVLAALMRFNLYAKYEDYSSGSGRDVEFRDWLNYSVRRVSTSSATVLVWRQADVIQWGKLTYDLQEKAVQEAVERVRQSDMDKPQFVGLTLVYRLYRAQLTRLDDELIDPPV